MSEYKKIIDEKYVKSTIELNMSEKYEISFIGDNNDNTMEILFIGDNNNKKFVCKYEICGVYDIITNLYTWGWDFNIIDRNNIQLTKKIKEFIKPIKSYIIDNTYSDIEYIEKIYYYLSHSIFFVNKDKLHDMHKFCVSVTDTKGFVKYKSEDNRHIVYYLITDILSR